jgi:hypothetical protein
MPVPNTVTGPGPQFHKKIWNNLFITVFLVEFFRQKPVYFEMGRWH